jgi:predicted  nucleic acid-binding Zn-ribbon protein
VRSPRDLEGLQKNIAGSDERIGVLETRVLEAMEREEALAARIAEVERALARDRDELSARRAEAAARIAAIDATLGQLEPRRQGLAEAVAEPVLRDYDRIRARAGGIGAALVAGGACGACGVALPPLLISRLGRGDGLLTCEHCGRILVGGA